MNSYMSEQLGGKFEGNWMIAISWEEVAPFLQQQSGVRNYFDAVNLTIE